MEWEWLWVKWRLAIFFKEWAWTQDELESLAPANPALDALRERERGNSSFLSRSLHLYQPELWQFNLFSVLPHELWMNPATLWMWWGFKLYNCSCSCHGLSMDLKKVGKREKNQGNSRSIKAEELPVLISSWWQSDDSLLCAERH